MEFREEKKLIMSIPISFVSVIPNKIGDPLLCKTQLMTSDSRLGTIGTSAKAIMKWDVNSTEKATLIIRLTGCYRRWQVTGDRVDRPALSVHAATSRNPGSDHAGQDADSQEHHLPIVRADADLCE